MLGVFGELGGSSSRVWKVLVVARAIANGKKIAGVAVGNASYVRFQITLRKQSLQGIRWQDFATSAGDQVHVHLRLDVLLDTRAVAIAEAVQDGPRMSTTWTPNTLRLRATPPRVAVLRW